MTDSFSFRDFDSIDVDALYEHIYLFDFSFIYLTSDVNAQLNFLNGIITELLNRYAPLKTVTLRKPGHWLDSPEVRNAKQYRNFAFEAYMEDKTSDNWKVYCSYRNKVNRLIKKNKYLVGLKKFSDKMSCKQLWVKLNGIGIGKDDDTEVLFDPDLLNNYFSTVQSGASSDGNFAGVSEHPDAFSFSNVCE